MFFIPLKILLCTVWKRIRYLTGWMESGTTSESGCISGSRQILSSSSVPKSFRGHTGRVIKDFFLFFNSLRKILWAQMSKGKKMKFLNKTHSFSVQKLVASVRKISILIQLIDAPDFLSKHTLKNLPPKTCIITWSENLKDSPNVRWTYLTCVCHLCTGGSRAQHLIREQIPWILYAMSQGSAVILANTCSSCHNR